MRAGPSRAPKPKPRECDTLMVDPKPRFPIWFGSGYRSLAVSRCEIGLVSAVWAPWSGLRSIRDAPRAPRLLGCHLCSPYLMLRAAMAAAGCCVGLLGRRAGGPPFGLPRLEQLRRPVQLHRLSGCQEAFRAAKANLLILRSLPLGRGRSPAFRARSTLHRAVMNLLPSSAVRNGRYGLGICTARAARDPGPAQVPAAPVRLRRPGRGLTLAISSR